MADWAAKYEVLEGNVENIPNFFEIIMRCLLYNLQAQLKEANSKLQIFNEPGNELVELMAGSGVRLAKKDLEKYIFRAQRPANLAISLIR
jgi:hypothetical protein